MATLAFMPAGVAVAAEVSPAPELKLAGPPTPSKDPKPTFTATAENYKCVEVLGNCSPVKVQISGVAAQELESEEITGTATTWSLSPATPLPPGEYTAVARQTVEEKGLESTPVSFTIAPGPEVRITFPSNGGSYTGESLTVAGIASMAKGDKQEVTVDLYAGAGVGPTAPLALTVQRSPADGSWSAPFGGLRPGTYTVQALQKDNAGSTGRSAPVTFTLNAPSAPPPPPPPKASFAWFPPNPTVGESVALVSSSTDASSPISAFAWDLAGNGPFKPGGPVLTTSFATPGNHVLRLLVTDARGATSVATETIAVGPSPLALMQPFPIVRIAGNQSSRGVLITLLTVQTPLGARVSVSCRGHGCNRKSVSRVAVASSHTSKSNTALISFRRLEHRLRAGAVLEIRVSQAGRIGKYTRFVIHRRRLPGREDACLSSTDPRPIACPA